MITDLLSDSYIEGIIKASANPPAGKTSGTELRELIKLMRDRLTARLNTVRGSIYTHYFRPDTAVSLYEHEELIGSDWVMIFRESALEIVSSESISPDQVKYDPTTGTISFGTALTAGELLTIIYSNFGETGSPDNTGFPYILPLTF